MEEEIEDWKGEEFANMWWKGNPGSREYQAPLQLRFTLGTICAGPDSTNCILENNMNFLSHNFPMSKVVTVIISISQGWKYLIESNVNVCSQATAQYYYYYYYTNQRILISLYSSKELL